MWTLIVVTICAYAAYASPSEDGRWVPTKYGNDGMYIPTDEGRYIHVPNPYIHMHNPYDGGYGPYAHMVPAEPRYKYVQSPPKDMFFYKEGYYRNNGIKILSQNHNYEKDKYNFDFETENKIRAEEKAVLKNVNQKDEMIASSGFYEYIGNDGYKYRVDYTADENGFRPKMKRIETPYSGKWYLEKINDDGKYYEKNVNINNYKHTGSKNDVNVETKYNSLKKFDIDERSNFETIEKKNVYSVKNMDVGKGVDNAEFIFEKSTGTEKNYDNQMENGNEERSFDVLEYATTEMNM